MEQLGGRREVHDLHVVLRAQHQEPFESGARVLGPLALEAVRKEQHQAAQAMPFVLGRRDELVDDHLRGVHEVSELRFPANQRVGRVERVAILEPDDAGLRQ